ncbi:MAG: hypothetical protein NT003_00235, partial [Candidatus Magasanikbacteria bacterium]|nr:hypothetical protein [Candidatus Magasanikbacteria bacterium]
MSFEFNIAGASADGSDGADGPNDEPKKSDAKPEHTELDAARAEFGAFFRGLEKTINGYYGTGDIAFTIKPGGWYVDLEKITVNADPEFFLKKGYSKSEALFATFHEAEHFRDMTRDSKVYKALFDRFKANA